MIDISYENVFRAMYPSLPDGWQKIILHAAFVDDSCHMKYYVKQQDEEYYSCFELGCEERMILEVIANIHQEIAFIRNQLTGKNKWNAITITIHADGSFRSEYDYSNLVWDSSDSELRWKEQYLND